MTTRKCTQRDDGNEVDGTVSPENAKITRNFWRFLVFPVHSPKGTSWVNIKIRKRPKISVDFFPEEINRNPKTIFQFITDKSKWFFLIRFRKLENHNFSNNVDLRLTVVWYFFPLLFYAAVFAGKKNQNFQKRFKWKTSENVQRTRTTKCAEKY